MARYTAGTVHYLRRVNTGNYEHKEFAADISWSADEGDAPLSIEEMIEKAADHAIGVVHQRLGLSKHPAVKPAEVRVAESMANPPAGIPISMLASGFEPSGEFNVVEAPQPATMASDVAAAIAAAKPAKKPRQGSVEALKQAAANAAAAQAAYAPPTDPLLLTEVVTDADPLLGDAAPAVIEVSTPSVAPLGEASESDLSADELDAMLAETPAEVDNDTLLKKMARSVQLGYKLPALKLMQSYTTQLAAMPQERRPEFLAKLAKLVPNL